jgi:hypothetical protein
MLAPTRALPLAVPDSLDRADPADAGDLAPGPDSPAANITVSIQPHQNIRALTSLPFVFRCGEGSTKSGKVRQPFLPGPDRRRGGPIRLPARTSITSSSSNELTHKSLERSDEQC